SSFHPHDRVIDRFVKYAAVICFLYNLFSSFFLLFIMIQYCRHLLTVAVSELSSGVRRGACFEENAQYFCIRDDIFIKVYLHYFYMAGCSSTYLCISWIVNLAV